MSDAILRDKILDAVHDFGPITTKEIRDILHSKNEAFQDGEVNSLLYGDLRTVVLRDVNAHGIPTWRIRKKSFEASSGLEVEFYNALLKKGIITKENAVLDYEVRNKRNKKTYHLDIAVFIGDNKYNIEVDGYDHMRADALVSIHQQTVKNGQDCPIEIDWMDNVTAYADFNLLKDSHVYRWCSQNITWCMRYHEELLRPKDIKRNIYLIENSWRVIRFWNTEIREDKDRCVKEVGEWIGK